MALTVLDSGVVSSTDTGDPRTLTIPVHASAIGVVIVLACDFGTAVDHDETGMTLGGQSPVASGIVAAYDTATEVGQAMALVFSAPPTGNQTLSLPMASATAADAYYGYINLGAGAGETGIEVQTSDIDQENQANPAATLSYGGNNCIAIGGLFYGGLVTAVAPGANCSQFTSGEGNFDSGNRSYSFIHQTTPGTSDFTIGWTCATDDVAAAYVAVKGVVGAQQQSLSGGMTPTGALVNKVLTKPSGAMTPTGALLDKPKLVKASATTPAGANVLKDRKPLAGAVTPAGELAQARKLLQSLTGGATPTGALLDRPKLVKGGGLTPTGAPLARVEKGLAGAMTPTGALSTARKLLQSLAGALTPTGAVVLKGKQLLAGAATLAGSLIDKARQLLAGGMTPSGAATHEVVTGPTQVALDGALTPAGALLRATGKLLAGAVDVAGTVAPVEKWYVALEAAIAPVGDLYHFGYAWVHQTTARARRLGWAVGHVTRLGWAASVRQLGWTVARFVRLAAVVTPPGQPETLAVASSTIPAGAYSAIRIHPVVSLDGSVGSLGTLTLPPALRAVSVGGSGTPAGTMLSIGSVKQLLVTQTSFSLSWECRPAMTGQVEYADNAGFVNSAFTTLQASPLTFHQQSLGTGNGVVPLRAGTTYYCRIYGTDALGRSTVSSTLTFATAIAQQSLAGVLGPLGAAILRRLGLPQTVSDGGSVTPAGDAAHLYRITTPTVTDTSIQVDWYAEPAMSGRIEYANNPNLTGSLLTNKQVSPLTHHVQTFGLNNPTGAPALEPGTLYYFRVVESTTAGGQTVMSAIRSQLTTGTPGGGEGIVYTDYVVPQNIATIEALQAFIATVPDGPDYAHHSRILLGAGRTYTGAVNGDGLDLTGRNHLTLDGEGTEVPYGHTGGAMLQINTDRNRATLKWKASGVWMTTRSTATSATDIRLCRLTIRGNSTNYATVNAYVGGEQQHGVYVGGADDVELRHVVIERVGGDNVYICSGLDSNSAAHPSQRVWVHDSTLQDNGRMLYTIIWGHDCVIEDCILRNAALKPWDVEPNLDFHGISGTTVCQRCRITGQWSWSSTYNDAVWAVNQHGHVWGTLSIVDNVIDATPTGGLAECIFKGSTEQVPMDKTATVYFERNVNLQGGRPAPILKLVNWKGTFYVRDNVDLLSSGTPYVSDLGGNTNIVQSNNT